MSCNYHQHHSVSYAPWSYDLYSNYPHSPDFYDSLQPIKYPEMPYHTYEEEPQRVDGYEYMIPRPQYEPKLPEMPSNQTSDDLSDGNYEDNNVENVQIKSASSGCTRRKMVELLHKGYFFENTQYLLLYTYALLRRGDNDIRWVDESKGIFLINNPDNFAKNWGAYKGKDKMDYQKVSRSFRYYYKQNLLKKVDGKLRQYQWDLKALKSLRENFNNGTPLKMENQQIRKKYPKL